MSASDLISFKVYFDKGSDNENDWEVRRFGIENNVATSFSYLIEKLKAVFPCLKNISDIHVYWKDTENDNVKISSDAELIIALTEIEQPIKKLYIKVMPSNNQVDDVPDHIQYNTNTANGDGDGWPEMHGGVICDCCDGPVIGFRYKCLQCPDYDLCSACEAKSFHPEHFMLRMPTPTQVDMKNCDKSKRGKCNSSHKKWSRAGLSSTAIAENACPFTKKFGRKHVKRNPPITSIDSVVTKLIPLFDNVCVNVLDGIFSVPPYSPSQQKQDINENNSDKSKEKSDTAAAAYSSSSIDNNVASGLTTENVSFKKPENKLQEQCASGTESKNSNANQNESNKTPAADSNTNINDPQEMIAKIIKSVIPVISDMLLNQDILKQNDGNINYNENKSSSQSSEDNQDKYNDGNAAAASEMLMGNDGIRVKAVEQQVVQQKDEENGWTLLTKEKDINGFKSTGAIPKTNINNTYGENKSCNESNNGPSPNGVSANNNDHQEKDQAKLRNSLKSMLDMGFTNEGNWLGDLLAKNDCNVAKVIELLTVPGRREKF